LNKAIDDVISVIVNSKDYQQCLQLKDKMKKNQELMKLIEDLKKTQKEYVKSGIGKEKIDSLEEELYQFPIYVVYMEHLEKVNDMLSYVEEDLNDYFYQLMN
jgi:cell fate (sporulation/competence/biofilm development) regulator YmcA (YheA/YmcA/DUF963 family)